MLNADSLETAGILLISVYARTTTDISHSSVDTRPLLVLEINGNWSITEVETKELVSQRTTLISLRDSLIVKIISEEMDSPTPSNVKTPTSNQLEVSLVVEDRELKCGSISLDIRMPATPESFALMSATGKQDTLLETDTVATGRTRPTSSDTRTDLVGPTTVVEPWLIFTTSMESLVLFPVLSVLMFLLLLSLLEEVLEELSPLPSLYQTVLTLPSTVE